MSARPSSFPLPVRVCLLGSFRVFAAGQPMSIKPGGKAEALLANLALQSEHGIARDRLLESLWPAVDHALAGQSLNTLVYSLNHTLGDALHGAPPIRYADGQYRLNLERGVEVDITAFDLAANDGDRAKRAGDNRQALLSYGAASEVYVGDLVMTSDVRYIVERERLRARYLGIRGWLAELRFEQGDYSGALGSAQDLLANDPCREDAHRVAMRAYNRLGQRAQALRQYRFCREVLAAEFDAIPEPATQALYDQLRVDPSRV